MSKKPARIAIGNGIHLTSITDSKFKRNRIAIHSILPLQEKTAAENAIVPLLLRKGCQALPDFTALNAKLNELYGASLATSVSSLNGYQILTVIIQSLDNRFALEGEDIIADCTNLLADLYLTPAFDKNGFFPAKDVELEKQYIIDTIEAEINDKRSYSVRQCIRHMTKGEPISVRRYGEVTTAKAITPESATKAWKRMIDTAVIEIFFTGSGNPASSIETFTKRLGSLARAPISVDILPIRDVAETVSEVSEAMDVQQGNLVLGLRVAGLSNKENKYASTVFSALYGGTPFSKLFVNVREKLGLCYYCSSSIDIVNNIMLISSGIEFEKKEPAQKEILHQLKEMQVGNFTEKELAETKLILTGSLGKVGDTLSSLEQWYFNRILLGEVVTPEEYAKNINKVTTEQVIASANCVTLDTVYFLKGSEA